jgi:hypothetical protein
MLMSSRSSMSAAHPVPKQFCFQHVKSHQDDKTDFEKLSFPAQVNVLCDQMATQQLLRQQTHESERTLPCPLTPRHLPVELAYRGQIISSHYVRRLREEITLARHRLFLQTKYKWDDASWDSIAWDSFLYVPKRLDFPMHRFVLNWSITGYTLVINDPSVVKMLLRRSELSILSATRRPPTLLNVLVS